MDAQMRDSSQFTVLQPISNEEPLRSVMCSRTSDHRFRTVVESLESQNHATNGADNGSAILQEETNDPNTSTSASRGALESHSRTDCYSDILTQTANLVQTLAQTAMPIGIDLVFEAERDFCALQNRLFACTGHSLSPQNEQLGSNVALQNTNSHDRPCLASDRPVLLSLALQAEHVIGLFEDLFLLASQAAHTLDKAEMGLFWSGSGPQDGVPIGSSARRLQRSSRSFWATPCVSPLVEASRDLRLGDFLMENPAKSKAMRRILTYRVDRMRQALQCIKRNSWKGEQDDGKMLDAPLYWGKSTSLMNDLAKTLVDDLIRRVETLQGAMVLIRNNALI